MNKKQLFIFILFFIFAYNGFSASFGPKRCYEDCEQEIVCNDPEMAIWCAKNCINWVVRDRNGELINGKCYSNPEEFSFESSKQKIQQYLLRIKSLKKIGPTLFYKVLDGNKKYFFFQEQLKIVENKFKYRIKDIEGMDYSYRFFRNNFDRLNHSLDVLEDFLNWALNKRNPYKSFVPGVNKEIVNHKFQQMLNDKTRDKLKKTK